MSELRDVRRLPEHLCVRVPIHQYSMTSAELRLRCELLAEMFAEGVSCLSVVDSLFGDCFRLITLELKGSIRQLQIIFQAAGLV